MKKVQNKEKIIIKRLKLSAVLIALNLVFLFVFKYYSNGLSLAEFKIFHIGNLLNLFFAVSSITGLLILTFTPEKISFFQTNLTFYLSILLIILFAAILFIYGLTDFKNAEIGFYPLKKVILGLLIIVNQFLQFFVFSFSWTLIFQTRSHVYLKTLILSILTFVILFLFAFLYTTLFYDGEYKITEEDQTLGIILGAAVYHNNEPSPVFRARIDKAYDLYRDGKIDQIQLTGGSAPGEITEAEAAFNYLEKLNVPADDINIEKSTKNTTEQIKFVRKELRNNSNFIHVIFISDHFHLQRVLEISDFFDVNAVGISSETKYSFLTLLFYKFRESLGLLFFWFFAI